MVSGWAHVTLEDACTVITDGTHFSPVDTGGPYPFITVRDMTDDGLDFVRCSHIGTDVFAQACGAGACPKQGDVLFSKDGTVGKVHVVAQPRPFAVLSSIAILRPNPKILDSIFLGYVLRSQDALAEALNRKTGSALRRIILDAIKRIPFLLPPIPEQQRLIAILQRADHLRRTRAYAQHIIDTFLQSVFLQMFDDPVRNPMGWCRATVADLGDVQTGNTPPRNETRYYGDHIEWIKSDDIIRGEIYVHHSKEMLSAEGLRVARVVSGSSILVTCIAGSATSIGNVAIADRMVTFNQQINSVTSKADVHPLFLYGLFLIAKPLVQRSTTLGMKRIITKSKFESLLLIKPPFQLQERFAQVVQRYERLSAQQREAERQAEHLFQTLLHRAFRGQI